VEGAQATGAMITFPNWEVLRSNIINYSRDFPYVWDEVVVGVANESDLEYTMGVLKQVARRVLGDVMDEPAEQYRRLLAEARLKFDVEEEPSVFLSTTDSWTNCTIRYLVPARSRRRWATKLLLELSKELSRPEHRGKIFSGYPRQEVVLKQEGKAS
jgi:small conductance mechanosensitive channel